MTDDSPAATPEKTAQHPAAAPHRFAVRELVAVIVLSVTAVVTAWCGFEASQWGGEMGIAFSQASAARLQATAAADEARDARQLDLTIYAEWVSATAEGRTEYADYVEERFTPVFAVAFDAWLDGGMVETSPFQRSEYVPPGTEEAKILTAQADAGVEQALINDQIGDNYSLLTVLFALVLFLTAVSQRVVAPILVRVMLGFAVGIAVVGVLILVFFPIRF